MIKTLPVLEHKLLRSRCLAFNIGGFKQGMFVERGEGASRWNEYAFLS